MRHTKYLFVFLFSILFHGHVLAVEEAPQQPANPQADTHTFNIELEPADSTSWSAWRPEYKKNVSFVATIEGETATGQKITNFTDVRFTFKIVKPSQWKGVCMNFKGDTDVEESYDLFFRVEIDDLQRLKQLHRAAILADTSEDFQKALDSKEVEP